MSDEGKFVGIAEIAAMLNLSRSTVRTMRTRNQLLEPDFEIQMGPVWRKRRVESWINRRKKDLPENGRKKG
jgi:predicted DNA-binding transcriptional regulator AlpA